MCPNTRERPGQESGSFLKKRTKKLLLLWRTLPDRTATATQKSFASFLQKRRLFPLPSGPSFGFLPLGWERPLSNAKPSRLKEREHRERLRATCRLMVDRIASVHETEVGACVGRLDDEDILRLNQTVLLFLRLAISPRTKPAA
jgi:mRNA interferase MazF